MEVKGTLLVDYVKAIKGNKDREWDKWLEPEDWELIEGNVLPSQWYPYDFYQRLGLAVFKEVAGSSLDLVRAFGKIWAGEVAKIYKNLQVEGDPAAGIEKLTAIQKTFFRGFDAGLTVIGKGPGWIKVKLKPASRDMDTEAGKAFGYQIAGSMEGIVEIAGGKNVSLNIEKIHEGFEYHLTRE